MTVAVMATPSPVMASVSDRQERNRRVLSYVSLIAGCELKDECDFQEDEE